MYNCNCGNCAPGFDSQSCQTCKPQLTEKASYPGGYDDNGNPRRLKGNGVMVANDESAFVTDGSVEKGLIPSDHEDIAGADYLMAVGGEFQYALGRNVPEGSVLLYKAGKWIVTSQQTASSIYNPAKLRTGGKLLAAFTCSTDGMLEMGSFTPKADSMIYWNAEKLLINATLTEFVARLSQDAFAAGVPIATADQSIIGYIGVTEDGTLVRTTDVVSPYYWLNPIVLVSSQTKYYGMPYGGAAIVTYPSLPPFEVGLFSDQEDIVDLQTLPGYSAEATMVVINTYLYIYSNVTGTSWYGVIAVNGIERNRGSVSNLDSREYCRQQCQIPIPSDKKLRVNYYRQNFAAAGNIESAAAGVLVEAFIKN